MLFEDADPKHGEVSPGTCLSRFVTAGFSQRDDLLEHVLRAYLGHVLPARVADRVGAKPREVFTPFPAYDEYERRKKEGRNTDIEPAWLVPEAKPEEAPKPAPKDMSRWKVTRKVLVQDPDPALAPAPAGAGSGAGSDDMDDDALIAALTKVEKSLGRSPSAPAPAPAPAIAPSSC